MTPDGDHASVARRQAAMAGHLGQADRARAHLASPHAKVRAAALSALARLGQLAAGELEAGLADPDPQVRRRACELAAARHREVATLLDDDDPLVVEAAAWATGERGGRAQEPEVCALARVASSHPDPLCREAAVAALGAVGHPGGKGSVLAALEDRPEVRRRAVLALAAFEGPDVEAALGRCLSDRDWQVRQAAEDLLGRR
jgi:HEAT repeat protein